MVARRRSLELLSPLSLHAVSICEYSCGETGQGREGWVGKGTEISINREGYSDRLIPVLLSRRPPRGGYVLACPAGVPRS